MDINEMPMDSVEYGGLTFPHGMDGFVPFRDMVMGEGRVLSENEREQIILKCKDAGSMGEVQRILDREVPGESLQGLLDRDKIR